MITEQTLDSIDSNVPQDDLYWEKNESNIDNEPDQVINYDGEDIPPQTIRKVISRNVNSQRRRFR